MERSWLVGISTTTIVLLVILAVVLNSAFLCVAFLASSILVEFAWATTASSSASVALIGRASPTLAVVHSCCLSPDSLCLTLEDTVNVDALGPEIVNY